MIENATQARENERYLTALKDLLYQLADDDLTIGHRDSEWLGLCPDIEGDVAFSSVAQDEVGHAVFYFDLLHELGEKDPDHLAFARSVNERRNSILLEQDNGNWAYSIVRHYFYDVFEDVRIEALANSSYLPLRQGVNKVKREEFYHLLHMKTWFVRLGIAGGEAKEKLEEAINEVWSQLGDLFSFGKYEKDLLELGIIGFGQEELKNRWLERVKETFEEAGVALPGDIPDVTTNGREGQHTEKLERLLATMSEVYNLDPAASW